MVVVNTSSVCTCSSCVNTSSGNGCRNKYYIAKILLLIPFNVFFFKKKYVCREVLEIGILLGLMCKYACENSEYRIYCDTKPSVLVELAEGTILDNMGSVLKKASEGSLSTCSVCHCRQLEVWSFTDSCKCLSCVVPGCQYASIPSDSSQVGFPLEHLLNCLRDTITIDNIIILNNDNGDPPGIRAFLDKYRPLVNPSLLYVNVDLRYTLSFYLLNKLANIHYSCTYFNSFFLILTLFFFPIHLFIY